MSLVASGQSRSPFHGRNPSPLHHLDLFRQPLSRRHHQSAEQG